MGIKMNIVKFIYLLALFLLPISLSAQIELTDRNGDGIITAVAIGDSLTSGVGDGVPSGVFIEEAPNNSDQIGYPGRLSQLLGINVVNAGKAGEFFTQGVEFRFNGILQSTNPDVIFLLEGSNDTGVRFPTDSYRATLQKLINIADILNITLIPITIPPICCNRAGREPFLEAYNTEIRNISAINNLDFVDLDIAFKTSCPVIEVCPFLNLPEGLHPNSEGYDFIARTIAEVVLGEPLSIPEEPEEMESEGALS